MSYHLLGNVFFPYCIELLNDNHIRFLNREYSPIGFVTKRFALTSEIEQSTGIKLQPNDITKLKALAVPPTDENRIFLYDDK